MAAARACGSAIGNPKNDLGRIGASPLPPSTIQSASLPEFTRPAARRPHRHSYAAPLSSRGGCSASTSSDRQPIDISRALDTLAGIFAAPTVIIEPNFHFFAPRHAEEVGTEATVVIEPPCHDSGPAITTAIALARD
jgi:hypothetical protein